MVVILGVFFTLCCPPTGEAATDTFNFTYANRDALLADGWSFMASLSNGAARDTEITNAADGLLVDYDQTIHPGTLRIPCDRGDLWMAANDTRNSLFRNLSSNWMSVRLFLTFKPVSNYQQVQLAVYQDDDNYVETGLGFNNEAGVAQIQEVGAEPHNGNQVSVASSNVWLRLDRDLTDGTVTSLYSLDGTNWASVGAVSQDLINPRLAIWVGGGQDVGGGNCDLRRLDIITSDSPVVSSLVIQPAHLVFNSVAGQGCTNLQRANVVRRGAVPLSWFVTNATPWISVDASNGFDSGFCNIGVNTSGLASGVYEAALLVGAPGASNTPAMLRVTLIVNPASRVRVATWRGGNRGAMTSWVDDSGETAFNTLYTNGFAGTYVIWDLTPIPPVYTNFYLAGMELGAHTVDHLCYALSEATLRFELESNFTAIETFTPATQAQIVSFGWPCGLTSPSEEAVAADYFLDCRGYNMNLLEDPSPNDFMNLKSFNSYEHTPYPPADLTTVVDGAIAQGKWFNMVMHNPYPNYDAAIKYAVGKSIWVAPGGTVTKYILQRDRTVISNYVESTGLIQFDCYRLPLDPSRYRSFESALSPQDTLTFQVNVTGLTSVVGVMVNGSAVPNYTLETAGASTLLLFDSLVTVSSQRVQVITSTNGPPVLAANSDQVLDEGQTLVITNSASDPNNDALTFSLGPDAPVGMTMTTNGVVSWTAGEANGGSDYTVTVVVTDNGLPPLSASNSFTISVNEINMAPLLPAQTDRILGRYSTLVVTNTAADADLPAENLSYLLVTGPTNAVIDAKGIITWTPAPDQVPSTNVFTTVVTDYNPSAVNAQQLSATNSFAVVVPATLHNGPSLPFQPDCAVNELTTLTVTNTAIDSDYPVLALTYQLVNPPPGADISANGVITWAPGELQGPGTNVITTVVSDNGTPPLSITNSFTVIVNEVNLPPILPPQSNHVVLGQTMLVVTNSATDPDLPANTLNYGLASAPAGASIGTNGIIFWTPAPAQVPSTNVFTTVVTDYNPQANNAQHLSATNSFTVFVFAAPAQGTLTLPVQPDRSIEELSWLCVTNTASVSFPAAGGQAATNVYDFTYPDRDTLLADGWSFVAISTNGQPRDTEILDPADGALVSFDQTGHPGVLRIPCDVGDMWGPLNTSRNSLFHSLPPNWVSMRLGLSFWPTLDFQQVHLGAYQDDDNYVVVGLAHHGSEELTMIWEQGGAPVAYGYGGFSMTNVYLRMDRDPSSDTLSGFYSADGTNWLSIWSGRQSLVNPRLVIWVGGSPVPYTNGLANCDLQQLTFVTTNASAAILTYQLVNPPDGMTIDTNGVITWTPGPGQGPSSNVVTTVVTDSGSPPLSATNSFTVIVRGLLTVTADNQSRFYGQANPELTGSVVGLQGGDNISAVYATEATEASPVGNYPITIGLLDPDNKLANYTVVTNTGTLSISPADSVLVVSSSANPAPSGSNVTFTARVSAVLPGSLLATGTVQFLPSGTVQFLTNGTALGGPVDLVDGMASMGTAALAHGSNSVVVWYGGDGNFQGSTNALSPDELVDAPPLAPGTSLGTVQNQAVSGSWGKLLARCTDSDGDTLSFVGVSPASALGGTVAVSGSAIVYTPPPAYNGADSFTYMVRDTYSAMATGTVAVTVSPLVVPPPRITAILPQPDGNLLIRCAGITNQNYVLQATVDWSSWTGLETNASDSSGLVEFLDLNATNYPRRFYRVSTP